MDGWIFANFYWTDCDWGPVASLKVYSKQCCSGRFYEVYDHLWYTMNCSFKNKAKTPKTKQNPPKHSSAFYFPGAPTAHLETNDNNNEVPAIVKQFSGIFKVSMNRFLSAIANFKGFFECCWSRWLPTRGWILTLQDSLGVPLPAACSQFLHVWLVNKQSWCSFTDYEVHRWVLSKINH